MQNEQLLTAIDMAHIIRDAAPGHVTSQLADNGYARSPARAMKALADALLHVVSAEEKKSVLGLPDDLAALLDSPLVPELRKLLDMAERREAAMTELFKGPEPKQPGRQVIGTLVSNILVRGGYIEIDVIAFNDECGDHYHFTTDDGHEGVALKHQWEFVPAGERH